MMWQEPYVRWKAYWLSGTSEFSPISANVEKFALFAIMLKVYVDNDMLLVFIVLPALILWNIGKVIAGWWRDRSLLWHYEAEFDNARNPTLQQIKEAVVKKEEKK